jgi:excinuclease UvrABC nuclease subunit
MSKKFYEKWQSVSSHDLGDWLKPVPYLSGVYVLYFLNPLTKKYDIVYIGSSGCIKKRILMHKMDNWARYSGGIQTSFGFSHGIIIKFKVVQEYGKWLMDEAKLIRRLKPKFNKYHRNNG